MREGPAGFLIFVILMAILGWGANQFLDSGIYLALAVLPLLGSAWGVGAALVLYLKRVRRLHQAPLTNSVAILPLADRFFKPQPALRLYPFGRGWQALDLLRGSQFALAAAQVRTWFRRARKLANSAVYQSNSFVKYLYWCGFFSLLILVCYFTLALYIFSGLAFALNLLLLVAWIAAAGVMIGLFSALNGIYSSFHKIFFRCPNCNHQMIIPIYICPSCHREHTRLWPSVYGIFRHTCVCGSKLPAQDLFGRTRLTQRCTFCHAPLNPSIGRQINVHVPIVGGPSTGKSNFIFQSTRVFIEDYAPPRRIQVHFPDEEHLRSYEANQRLASSGQVLNKTSEIVPQAYNLSINRRGDAIGRIVYIYDAAGEAYAREENALQQKPYYDFAQSLILIIDPFSIEMYSKQFEKEIQQIDGFLRPSTESAMEAYNRMLTLLEWSFGLQNGQPYRLPVAVVISKCDALNLRYEIGPQAARSFMHRNPSVRTEADAIDILVERFLIRYQMGNFVRDIKMRFAQVRFFSCSALGRMPDPDLREEYKPSGVLEPFLWIMSQAGVVNITAERVKRIDQEDLRHVPARKNLIRQVKHYLWDSLRPYRKPE